jgi:hypothetical protein
VARRLPVIGKEPCEIRVQCSEEARKHQGLGKIWNILTKGLIPEGVLMDSDEGNRAKCYKKNSRVKVSLCPTIRMIRNSSENASPGLWVFGRRVCLHQ